MRRRGPRRQCLLASTEGEVLIGPKPATIELVCAARETVFRRAKPLGLKLARVTRLKLAGAD